MGNQEVMDGCENLVDVAKDLVSKDRIIDCDHVDHVTKVLCSTTARYLTKVENTLEYFPLFTILMLL